jgi:hypothetical protein
MQTRRNLYRSVARIVVLTMGLMSVVPLAGHSCHAGTDDDAMARNCLCHNAEHSNGESTDHGCKDTSPKSPSPSAFVAAGHTGCCQLASADVDRTGSAAVVLTRQLLTGQTAAVQHAHSPPGPRQAVSAVSAPGRAAPLPVPLFLLNSTLLR